MGRDSRSQRPPSLEPAVSRTASGGLSRNTTFSRKVTHRLSGGGCLVKVNLPRQSLDVLYFRVSGDRQTTENQFEDLLQVAQRDGSDRDWVGIRKLLSRCVHEEQVSGANGDRVIYRVRPEVVTSLAGHCVYVEQGKSSRRERGGK